MGKDDVKKLGELFKHGREEKNISLKEVENATSIRTNYLKAIEDGDMKKLISPVYAQGFVKQYAIFLGMNGDEILREYQSCFGALEKQEFDYGIGTLEKRGSPGSSAGLMPGIIYLCLVAAITVLAWYFAHFMGLL